jgi:phage shock protein A
MNVTDDQAHQIAHHVAHHDKELERHSQSLRRIGDSLESLQRECHEIRVTLRERDQTTKFLKATFNSILVAVVIQLAATVWWAAKMDAAVQAMTHTVSDHEERLRSQERVP